MSKRLDKSFPRDDVDPDDQEDDAPATGDPDGEEPQDDPGYAPEDPPSLIDQLEASDNPLMKIVAQEFRTRDSREDALRNELAAVKREADQRRRYAIMRRTCLPGFDFRQTPSSRLFNCS